MVQIYGYIRTTYNKLVSVFGEPTEEDVDPWKMSVWWKIENVNGLKTIDIYDWKNYKSDYEDYEEDGDSWGIVTPKPEEYYNWTCFCKSKEDVKMLRKKLCENLENQASVEFKIENNLENKWRYDEIMVELLEKGVNQPLVC